MTRPERAWLLSADRFPTSEPAANHLRQEWLLHQMAQRWRTTLFSNGWKARASQAEQVAEASHYRLPGLGSESRRSPLELVGVTVLALPWLFFRAQRYRPALLLTQSPVFAPLLWLLRRRSNRPFLHVDVIGLASWELEQSSSARYSLPIERRVWRFLERLAVRNADLVTTVNKAHARVLAQWGVEAEVLRDASPEMDALPASLPPELGIGEGDVVLLFAGSLVSHRLDGLFGALESLAGRAAQLKVIIAGAGPDKERYCDWAQSVGLHQVVFAGYRHGEEIKALLQRADIAFSDCWSDLGFPWKAFEYLAYGKAIIIEDKPQMHEVLDEETAIFYRFPDDLADTLEMLHDDVGKRRKLGEAARALAESESWSARGAQLQALWRQMT